MRHLAGLLVLVALVGGGVWIARLDPTPTPAPVTQGRPVPRPDVSLPGDYPLKATGTALSFDCTAEAVAQALHGNAALADFLAQTCPK